MYFTHTITLSSNQNQDGHQIFKTTIKRDIIISVINNENVIFLRIGGLRFN